MTKAQDQTEAWATFHENLPAIVKFLRKANVIRKKD